MYLYGDLLSVLIFLIRRFTKPILKLDRVAAHVDSGNLLVRSHIRGDDEIGRLGHSFDSMLDNIQEMIKQVTLEQQLKHKAEIDLLQAQINPHFCSIFLIRCEFVLNCAVIKKVPN